MLQNDEILIVDDEESARQFLADVLSYENFQVLLAGNGELALELARSHAIKLILLDINMRGMSGLEVCRRLKAREESRNIPVIIISGTLSHQEKMESFSAGAVDFIAKPFQIDELLARVRTQLELNRLRAGLEAQVEERTRELRESEKKYRNIFDRVLQGLFQTTPEGRIITANKALAGILAYESPAELMETMTDMFSQMCNYQEDCAELMRMAEKFGYVKGKELRLKKKDGNYTWVSMDMQPFRNGKGQIIYFEGSIEDISERKRLQLEQKELVKKLRQTLEGTIQALAITSETRDPYTAGHQRNVAHLACLIATKMGLKSDRIEGLRMAGMIHDIGKISIPAEILSTPRVLTDIEYNLVKTHVLSGYNILKDIEFPWPIARMVLEHHERMDGSGYPQSIMGKDILPESRILAVADVVEAIASHRPYRPAKGFDNALEEIAIGRGVHYDSAVVDVCLKLFQDRQVWIDQLHNASPPHWQIP